MIKYWYFARYRHDGISFYGKNPVIYDEDKLAEATHAANEYLLSHESGEVVIVEVVDCEPKRLLTGYRDEAWAEYPGDEASIITWNDEPVETWRLGL